jgi:hypothetical protein
MCGLVEGTAAVGGRLSSPMDMYHDLRMHQVGRQALPSLLSIGRSPEAYDPERYEDTQPSHSLRSLLHLEPIHGQMGQGASTNRGYEQEHTAEDWP